MNKRLSKVLFNSFLLSFFAYSSNTNDRNNIGDTKDSWIGRRKVRLIMICLVLMLTSGVSLEASEILLIYDPLDHGTIGVQEGGTFVEGGGWQAAGGQSRITYDLGQTYGEGRFEIDVHNFLPCSQPNNEKCHILSMWQSENQDRQSSADAGESSWIFRTGTNYFGPPCEYKLLTRPVGFGELGWEARIDQNFPWDANTTYHYTISWNQSGRILMVKRHPGGEQVLYDHEHGLPFRLRYLLVGRDRETKPNYGEQPGVIYSNVKVFVEENSGGEPGLDGGADGGEIDGGDDSGLRVVFLDPIDDTFAHYLEPDLVHGDQSTVQIGGDGAGGFGRIIYFKFDLTSIKSLIYSAKLHLRATNAGGGGWITDVPDNSWQEETLTWETRPAVGSRVIDQLGQVEIGQSYGLDLTNSVYAGDVYSFAMLSTENDGAAYGSKEHPDFKYRPQLELVLGEAQQDGGNGEVFDGGDDSSISDAEEEDITTYDIKDSDITDFSDIPDNLSGDIIQDVSNDITVEDTLIEDNFSEDINGIEYGNEEDIKKNKVSETSSGGCSCSIIAY